MEIKITHLYPDLLNLYGDKGNIASLCKRLSWREITPVLNVVSLNETPDLTDTDILFLGGGSDRELSIVGKELVRYRDVFSDYIENNGVMLAVCGGFSLLGKYLKTKDETIEGLGVLDLRTEYSQKRIMGKVVLESALTGGYIVGFENHTGKIESDLPPLGKVLYGMGNNGKDKKEGALYKNTAGTNLHGPILPANPELTDYILSKALNKKYGEVSLSSLDDSDESKAKNYIVSRLIKS